MPAWYIYSVTFLFGALIGSFLNVVGLRFLKGESIVWPGSHCPVCNTPLRPYENIPILSWLALRGRCRTCHVPISPQYPAVELLTALLFVATVHQFGLSLQTGLLLVLFCSLVVVLITDFRAHYIFDVNSLGLIPFGLIYSFLNLDHQPGQYGFAWAGHTMAVPFSFLSAVLAVAGSFVLFYALNMFSRMLVGKPGFGEGDTRLLMGMGAFFGIHWMVLIFVLGFALQAGIGLPMLVVQWLRQKAYAPVLLFLGALFLAVLPTLLQAYLAAGPVLIIFSLICAAMALVCTFLALQRAKNLPTGLTMLPFGPALAAGCGLMVFYHQPIQQFVSAWFNR